jgi:starvation-inducible outer membrane lipoprotein
MMRCLALGLLLAGCVSEPDVLGETEAEVQRPNSEKEL